MGRPAAESSTSPAGTSVSDPPSDAGFSSDGHYRWWLRRRWSGGSGTLVFIGLNPSAADGRRDDPTLRRLIGFGRGWGYNELVVLNLFARISPSPAVLRRVKDPIGVSNDLELKGWCGRWASQSSIDLWCGWGGSGACRGRDQQVLAWLDCFWEQRQRRHPSASPPFCIGLTRTGQPRHPLYASADLTLRPFIWAGAESIGHPEGTPKALLQR